MASLTLPSKSDLVQFYQGKDVADVPKPAAVLDRAIIRRHCARMKKTVKALNVGFRAHVKTHKTIELATMQIDQDSSEANFIASTPLEIEMLVPLLKQAKATHRKVNVLYGVPLVPSHIDRLASLALTLDGGDDDGSSDAASGTSSRSRYSTISFMIDHPSQLPSLSRFASLTKENGKNKIPPPSVFVKVDTGYHRAGLPPLHLNKQGLLENLAQLEKQGEVYLLGLYSHSSSSYSATTAEEAMSYLVREIRGCQVAWEEWKGMFPTDRELIISVGATPQVASSETLVAELSSSPSGSSEEARELAGLLLGEGKSSKTGTRIELHAGNYAVLDMQQLSTHARRGISFVEGKPEEEVALSVVAEVCSVYNGSGEREARGKPEALVAAGTLALGREPCGSSYPGWGVVVTSSGNGRGEEGKKGSEKKKKKLIVERISQEHGIVSWWSADGGEEIKKGDDDEENIPLEVGMTVRVYPNHACITASFYNWFFVVDSDEDPTASRIVDVWPRARAAGMDPFAATRLQ